MQDLCILVPDGLADEIEMTEMELVAAMRRMIKLDLYASERIMRLLVRARIQESIDLCSH